MTTIIVISTLFYLFWLVLKPQSKYIHYVVYIAWLSHALICFYSLIDEQGWKLHIINAILLVSWLCVLIVLLFKIRSSLVKLPLLFFVFSSYLAVYLNKGFSGEQYKQFSWQLDLHISLSMLAYSILTVAALFALSLLVYIKKIKNSNFKADVGLLSIIEEEKKLFHLIFLGWLILSTSLISGVIFIEDFVQQHLGHKIVFSILAWLIFGMLILGRMTKGWRGEKLIILTITGMTFLSTGYLGSKIVLEWILKQ